MSSITLLFFPACGLGKWSFQTAWDWQYVDRFRYDVDFPSNPLGCPEYEFFIEKDYDSVCVVRV